MSAPSGRSHARAPAADLAGPLLDDPLGLLDRQSVSRRGPIVGLSAALVAVVALTVVALLGVRRSEKVDIAARLEGEVNGTMEVLDVWSAEQQRTARTWAADPIVIGATEELLAADDPLLAPAQQQLRSHLAVPLELHGYLGFFVVAPDGTSLGSTRDANTGTPNLVAIEQPERLQRLFDGDTAITTPQVSDVPLPVGASEVETVLTMFAGSPILDDDGDPIAVLLFRMDVPSEFSSVFTLERRYRTDEILAFDDVGRMLVPSRFATALAERRDVGATSGTSR